MTAPFEHASEVRDALCSIVADPALGSESLASTQTAANLLRDLLPDAPRETSLLLAAIASGAPAMLREHTAQGLAGDTAISLTAASLASRTAFTQQACQWVITEFAIALSLVPAVPVALAAQSAPHPPAQASTEAAAAPTQEPTVAAAGRSKSAMPATAPEAFGPEPSRQHRGSGHARLALLAAIVLALAGAAGAGLYATRAGTTAHHRSAPGPQRNSPAPAPVTSGKPDNIWIAQLASVSRNAGHAALDSALARVRVDVPHAQILSTHAHRSLRPGFWVIYYAGHFTTGIQALAYCAAHGRATRDLCIGRYLSNNAADIRYQCYPPAASPSGNCTRVPTPSPVNVVKAYIAAVNRHNWAQVWALGGKNLGETYQQLIAGYAHTSHVQITGITASGPAVTVVTTATETNGASQRYRLTYLVSHETITAGQSVLING